MLDLLLSAAILCGFSIVGFAVWPLVVCAVEQPLARLLFAPGFGVAVVVLPVFWLSRAGLPVGTFGGPLTAILLGVAVVMLGREGRRAGRLLPAGAGPVGVAIALAMAFAGWPALLHGSNWLAFANEDMTHYVLSAHRFLVAGYADAPALAALRDHTDVSQYFWFLHVVSGVRPGSELLLALINAVFPAIDGFAVYMPTLIAFHGILVAAVAGTVVAAGGSWKLALAVVFGETVCSLMIYSVYSQLIAQLIGLALVATLLVVLAGAWRQGSRRWCVALLAAVLLAAQAVIYPECLPLVALALLLHYALHARSLLAGWRRVVVFAAIAAAGAAALLGPYLFEVVSFILAQAGKGVASEMPGITLFPYFFAWSGVAHFWGLTGLTETVSEPWQTRAVVAGAILSLVAVVTVIAELRRGQPVTCFLAVMLALMTMFFMRKADFALFKAVLYLQPFLVAHLAAVIATRISPRPAHSLEERRWRQEGSDPCR